MVKEMGGIASIVMEEYINMIFEIIKDYRSDENNPTVHMTPERIRRWINQFENSARIPILRELVNIFTERYLSKEALENFFDMVVKVLCKRFEFQSAVDFLKNASFLDLQPEGKSQGIMLSLFEEYIFMKYELELSDTGTVSKKYSIYLDDILCTGLTFFSNIKEWAEQEFSPGKTNKEAVSDESTVLVCFYVFIHLKNYEKKIYELGLKVSYEIANKLLMLAPFQIENKAEPGSKLDLILPTAANQPESIINYKNDIKRAADERADNNNWRRNRDEFFRPTDSPGEEKFFTSAANRKIVEDAFLKKGIEILSNSNSRVKNIRALGYSLPSYKDFGFGALCFTWRNIPNNAPLVFWYSVGNFTPLFVVKRGNNSVADDVFLNTEWEPDYDS